VVSVSMWCVSVYVRALKRKRIELSTANLVHVYFMAVARHALTRGQKVKGHGCTVMKTVTVTWLLVKCAAAAGVGLNGESAAFTRALRNVPYYDLLRFPVSLCRIFAEMQLNQFRSTAQRESDSDNNVEKHAPISPTVERRK